MCNRCYYIRIRWTERRRRDVLRCWLGYRYVAYTKVVTLIVYFLSELSAIPRCVYMELL